MSVYTFALNCVEGAFTLSVQFRLKLIHSVQILHDGMIYNYGLNTQVFIINNYGLG